MIHLFSTLQRRKFSQSSLNSFHIQGSLLINGPIVGSNAKMNHYFNETSVFTYSQLCGDNNPIHLDAEFAKTTKFGRKIVHGMLVSSLFSTLFGRSISSSIYVDQSIHFKAPVFVGSAVTAEILVTKVEPRRSAMLITCTTKVTRDEDNVLVVDGVASVLLPMDKYNALITK